MDFSNLNAEGSCYPSSGRRYGSLLAIAFLFVGATAAAQQISNVQARQLTDSQTVEVVYDLTFPNVSGTALPGSRVTVAFASDGTNFSILPAASSLSGDVGPGITPGTGKKIVWNSAGTLSSGFYSSQFRAAVTAITEGDDQQEITVKLPGDVPMTMLRVPAGTFRMGSSESERGRQANEGPVHDVTLENDYFIGKTEVTQGQWQALMGKNPSSTCGNYGIGETFPVFCVTFSDINGEKGFMLKLNQHAAATGQPGSGEFRLPTEAEWERAARAGTDSRYSFGDALSCGDGCAACSEADLYMWWCGNASRQSHEAGSKRPNAFGLLDMHGNLWEWVSDWYGAYAEGAQTNPSGPAAGSVRVIRGGSWWSEAREARSAWRGSMNPAYKTNVLGFRVARRAASGVNGYSDLFTVDLRGPAPTIQEFVATPTSVNSGDAVTLSWASDGGARAEIDQGVGTVPTTGSTKVYPTKSTTYTLVVTSSGGRTSSSQAHVDVASACQKPGKPVFNVPANTTIIAGSPITFTWSATISGQPRGTYLVDVAPNATCTAFSARYPSRDATLTFIPQTGVTSYCFVVYAMDENFCVSDASDPLKFGATK